MAHAEMPEAKVRGRRRRLYRPYWYPRVSVGVVTLVAVLALGLGVPLFSLITRPHDPFRRGAGHSNDAAPVVQAPLALPSGGSSGGAAPAGAASASKGSSPGASPSSSDSSASPAASQSPGAGPGPDPGPAPVPAALRATYATLITRGPSGGKGYDGQITISNPGGVAVTGWTVTITVTSGQTVTYASGAAYQQNGTSVTFTPVTGTATVPAQGSVKFRWGVDSKVTAPPGPATCYIDGSPCG